MSRLGPERYTDSRLYGAIACTIHDDCVIVAGRDLVADCIRQYHASARQVLSAPDVETWYDAAVRATRWEITQ